MRSYVAIARLRRDTCAFSFLLATLASGSACIAESGLVDCSAPQSAGLETCPCTPEGGCMQGLKCLSNTCVDPGAIGTDNTGGGGNESASTEGEGCTPGAPGCSCVDGACGLGLVCTAGLCENDDSDDSDDSSDSSGNVTDTGGTEAMCADRNVDGCYIDGQLRSCCETGDVCLGDDLLNACEPPCRTHTECFGLGIDCCARVDGLSDKFCSPNSQFCGGVLCIDTCGIFQQDGEFAYDSECDDLSGYEGCEYGTDCGDCGPRVPKEMMTVGDPEFMRVVDHEYRPLESEVRVLFDQRADLEAAIELIRVFDERQDAVEIDFRPSLVHTFKGIPAPADNLVIVSWSPGTRGRGGSLHLFVAQDEMHADYRADMPVPKKR